MYKKKFERDGVWIAFVDSECEFIGRVEGELVVFEAHVSLPQDVDQLQLLATACNQLCEVHEAVGGVIRTSIRNECIVTTLVCSLDLIRSDMKGNIKEEQDEVCNETQEHPSEE